MPGAAPRHRDCTPRFSASCRAPMVVFPANPQAHSPAMQITWYGHSAFRLDFAGHAVLIDPFFTGNPAFVSDKAAASKGVKHIVLTHGHGDHVGDTLDIARSNGATVTTNYDLGMWLRVFQRACRTSIQ